MPKQLLLGALPGRSPLLTLALIERHGNGNYGHCWFRCLNRFSKKTRYKRAFFAKLKDEADLEIRRREASKELPRNPKPSSVWTSNKESMIDAVMSPWSRGVLARMRQSRAGR